MYAIKPDLRITLDTCIRYGRVALLGLSESRYCSEISALAQRNVLEVKYSSLDEDFSALAVSSFSDIALVNERHSKYCNAIEALLC